MLLSCDNGLVPQKEADNLRVVPDRRGPLLGERLSPAAPGFRNLGLGGS